MMEKNDGYIDLEQNKSEDIKPTEIKPMAVEELNILAILLLSLAAMTWVMGLGNCWSQGRSIEYKYGLLRNLVHTISLLAFCLVIFVLLPYGRHHTTIALNNFYANHRQICFDFTSIASYLFIFVSINIYFILYYF